jgi:hypothetical protein
MAWKRSSVRSRLAPPIKSNKLRHQKLAARVCGPMGGTAANYAALHLKNHRFDEPRCLDILSRCDPVVAIHARGQGTTRRSSSVLVESRSTPAHTCLVDADYAVHDIQVRRNERNFFRGPPPGKESDLERAKVSGPIASRALPYSCFQGVVNTHTRDPLS